MRQRHLRVPTEFIDLGDPVHASDSAELRAALHPVVLAPQILGVEVFQRDAGTAALLGTPVDEAVFTNLKIPRPCSAVPGVRQAVREVPLEPVVVREVEYRFANRHDLLDDCPLPFVEREQPAARLVDDPHRC